ncbi:response regulator [Roseovarius sp. MMSF_3281]|uniref:hybrid sensor histidine kinase/response regulator n=1 Tax=Roseovarius sp. MMSF_3281 TaxID=3046694 RepID=UPI00273E06A9|nr:response regulator [Roseovarius sp. MMSF_3281]
MRPVIQAIGRMIATDRRPSVLANDGGTVLLANAPAQRLQLDKQGLHDALDWPTLCKHAHRAGSAPASLALGSDELEGEVVHLSLGAGDGYLLRLSENDHEATWLRNRARAATLMRVAHDLRTPIQSLLATAQKVLDDSGQSGPAGKALAQQQLEQSAEVALDHISNVLGVIRGEQSVTGIRPDETFNITEELRTLIMMISPIARKQNVDLKLWLDPHEDTWVHGPVRFVRALFQNIIDNSAKYGGSEVEIGLTCRPLPSPDKDDDRLKIILTVKDLGGGLPPEQKARLFAALGQSEAKDRIAPQSSQRPSAGLNVLAHALHQLGGQLELTDRYAPGSETGKEVPGDLIGTTIQATMTLGKGARPDNLNAAEGEVPVSDDSLSGLSILLVEDSPSSRDWLHHILKNAGAHVWAAGNAVEALSLISRTEVRERLDLILTDMTLPYMSGVEFAKRVQQMSKISWDGPVLALTAHVADEIIAACHAAGIAEVLEKPIRPAQLRNAILAALDGSGAKEMPALATPQAAPTMADETLNEEVVKELLAQFGTEGATSFMRRAQNEASGVLTKLQNDGTDADTGRMLHAATGACSLTGLAALETCLRTMEQAFDTNNPLEPCQQELETALLNTKSAIASLTSGS